MPVFSYCPVPVHKVHLSHYSVRHGRATMVAVEIGYLGAEPYGYRERLTASGSKVRQLTYLYVLRR